MEPPNFMTLKVRGTRLGQTGTLYMHAPCMAALNAGRVYIKIYSRLPTPHLVAIHETDQSQGTSNPRQGI
jgi:hypothetical protein